MAEGKKSFVLYTDIKSTVDKLPDEKAGALFKHILAYVNDENPTTDDLIIELVFEPIKQQLKRSLKNWEESKENKSKSGRLGNLKRWNPDLYSLVISENKTLEEAEEIATSRKVSHCDVSQQKVSHSVAKIAVNVNDSVSVNVNDNIIQEEILVSPKVETKQKKAVDFDFSFVNENFKEAFFDWLSYKKAKGQKYKSQQSLEICYKNLLKISNNNSSLAKECVENSIANNYSGIFPVKTKPNASTAKPNKDYAAT